MHPTAWLKSLEGFEKIPQIPFSSALACIIEINSDNYEVWKARKVDSAVIVEDPARELSDHNAPKMGRILVFPVNNPIHLPNALPIRKPTE